VGFIDLGDVALELNDVSVVGADGVAVPCTQR
jgi:hypothetical protein